jgi:hypothetical protein
VTPKDIDAVLRDRLVRESGLESQVDVDEVLDSVHRRVRRRRHRRRLATVVTVAVVIAVGAAVASLAYDRREGVQVGPPASVPDSTGEIDAELLWVDWQGPTLVDPNSGETLTIEPRNGRTWCGTCPFVRVGDQAFTSQGERIYAYTPGDTELRDIGAGDAVFPAADGQSIFVVADNQLEQRTVEGASVAGPWPIPSGYNLTFPPRATATGVLVEATANAFIRQLAEWRPSTGEIQPIGTHNRLVDTYIAPDGTTTIARTDCTANFPCWLLLTDTSTGQTTRVDSPVPGNGFYGGGAFSPDGSQLAVFIATNRGSVNPAARLGIVDVDSGRLRMIDESDVPVGESYGYASWSPSGDWLFFDALSQNVRALRRGSDEARELHLAGAYSLIAIDRRPESTARSAVESVDETRLVGEGETDGVAWELRASENEICLVIAGDGVCTSAGGEWVSDGVSVRDGQERRVLWGAVRRRMPDRVSGGFREAARIEVQFADGEVVETSPVGLDAGFPTVFYVAKISADIPAQDTIEVVAYDAEGEELTRFGPVNHDLEELDRLRVLGKG